jgi:hypothetical protein
MKTLNEQLDARFGSMGDALRAIAQCRTVEELRQAIRAQEPIVTEAERFAGSIAHVETREAAAFCDEVRIVRRALDHRKGTLKGVEAPVAVQFVTSDTPSKPKPPANALVLTREQARDLAAYQRAKARAEAEGKTLWIEPM